MAYLEEQDWLVVNKISYDISVIYDFDEMRKDMFEWLNILMDFDSAIFSLIKSEGTAINVYKPLGYKVTDKYMKIWNTEMQNSKMVKLLVHGVSLDTSILSETFSDTTWKEAPIYEHFYKPQGFDYSMSTCLIFKNHPIGYLQFFRKYGSQDFTNREVFIIEQLYKHLAYRANYESKKSETRFFAAKSYLEQLQKKYHFTDREIELFEYAIKGMTNVEIADSMMISVHTVKKHFHNIYDKMGIAGRVELLQSLPHSYNKMDLGEL